MYRFRPSEAQMKLARRIESAGITTISQVVKAFERHDDERISEWKEQLRKIDAERGYIW